jgi:hypothetical protein
MPLENNGSLIYVRNCAVVELSWLQATIMHGRYMALWFVLFLPIDLDDGIECWTYDLLGNRQSDNHWHYYWDSTNRLVGMSPWNMAEPVYSFVYRADGLRIKKVKHEQQEVPIAEMLDPGTTQR